MCDFSGKLTAWLDRELSASDAADVGRHLRLCAECRGRVEAYGQVSRAFEAYCDAYCEDVLASRPRRQLSRRTLTVSAVAAVAAAVAALFLFASPGRVRLSLARTPALKATSSIISESATQVAAQAQSASPSVQNLPELERRHAAEPTRRAAPRPRFAQTHWPPAPPAVEIAIPADAIFPPGAAPEGVSFAADVTIAPDGSAQQIRLRPQLTEFERRPTRP
ncbi:MAG: hypothetical protein DMG32_10355 [Acidobacteria bacterium]|nr:MAG: hypothetical protein DMG32_10355 [Acidobacteriota bacterium]